MRETRFGRRPLVTGGGSDRSTLMVQPTLGLVLTQSASNLPPGATPSSVNFINGYIGLEKRWTLTSRSTQSLSQDAPILGGAEIVDVTGTPYQFASTTTRPLWYSNGSWSFASYVSSNGINDAPSLSTTSYWDIDQIYYDTQDENCAVLAAGSYQTLYIWQSGKTVFSTLSNAPRARFVTGFDNFLVAGNIRQGTSDFVQRVEWSDRGSIATWLLNAPTGSLAGYADLLDMKGQITRLVGHDNRVVVFSDQEVWAGGRVDFPASFDFQPLDRTVGAPYSWTVAVTRLGVCWLGKDYNVYLLPKGGAQAQPIGTAVQPELQATVNQPERAWGVYNKATDQYELYYPTRGGSGYPQAALYFDLRTGTWLKQTFDATLNLTRGWMGSLTATTTSNATTWADAQTAGLRWADVTGTWGDYGASSAGQSGDLAVHAGLSTGSVCYFSKGTTDLGVVVESRWRSGGLGGAEPYRNKTLYEVRVDYQADSASSLTIRASRNQGESFEAGQQVALPTNSIESQARATMQVNSRYPVFEVTTEIGRPKLNRFWTDMRIGSR